MTEFREVTKDEFFAHIGPRDVHPRIVSAKWPYTAEWELRPGRTVVGRTTGRVERGAEVKSYWIRN